jgi:hypothetical protein
MGIENIREQNLNSELLREINKDEFNIKDKTTTIDLMTRLSDFEISNILAIDSLVMLDFLPKDFLNFTRQKKRLNVSLGGEGRKEIIRIFESNKEEETKVSKNMFARFIGGGNK